MSLLNIRAFKAKQLTSKLAVAGLLASGLTVAPFFAGAVGGYTVPAGADVIQVVAVGGAGGTQHGWTTVAGGKGCELSASFEVVEGDTFSEVLGGNGGDGYAGNTSTFTTGGTGGTGANGRDGGDGADYNFLSTFRGSGTGGGGATSVYRGADEVMISGGGGGAGGYWAGGAGCGSNTLNGGRVTGWDGNGYGGTQTEGGAGGGWSGSSSGADRLWGVAATSEDGADAPDATSTSNGFGSGGGGGYWGGGSGSSAAGCCVGASGGAGSSWAVTPPAGIKAATGKAATVAEASVNYYAVDFPVQALSRADLSMPYTADLNATFKGVQLSNASTALWTVSPALPAGLTLNAATGVISGTPTESASADYLFKAAWKSGSDIIARSFQTIHLEVGPPPPTPGAPVITAATVLNTNVTLEWTPPTYIGTSNITDYVIEYSLDGGTTWLIYDDGVSTSTTTTLRNLEQLTDYEFRVTAVNDSGEGVNSDSYSATTGLGVPGQVHISDALITNTGARLFWTAPDEGGAPISDYIIEYSLDGGATWLVLDDGINTSLEATLNDLGQKTTCVVRIAAVNELGTGDFSEPYEFTTGQLAPTPSASPTVEPTPTETATPTPTPSPTSTKTPKPTPSPTKTTSPKPSPSSSESASSEPSAEPTASPSAIPASVLSVLAEPYKHKGAIVELAPLNSVAYEDGAAVPVKLIKKGTQDGYILDGTFFDLELAATDESGNPVQLDEEGNLVLEKDRYASFSGTGFAPNSPVQVWLFSIPTKLKRVMTDAQGNFSGSAIVPDSIAVGEHTVQLNGVSEDGKVRSVALGVVVEKPSSVKSGNAFDWGSLAMWSVLALLIAAFVWWFIIARRRKREEEQAA